MNAQTERFQLIPEMQALVRELKWHLRLAGGNAARVLFPSRPEQIRIAVDRVKSQDPWDIQLNQPNLPLQGGLAYEITFQGRADRPREIRLGVSRAHDPWDALGFYEIFDLTKDWKTFRKSFTATASDENARIHFDLGGNSISLDLATIVLERQDGQAVEPDLLFQGYYPATRQSAFARTASERKTPRTRNGSMPRISVVIPTYQRREVVLESVRSLAVQDFAGDFELIVVVDGSKDGSAEALRALEFPFPITVIEQPNQGASKARNRGAVAARGEILLFLDDDMVAHPRLLAEHVSSHAEGADVVLGHLPLHPKARANPVGTDLWLWAADRARRLTEPGVELTYDEILSGQLSVRREVYEKCGGFDASFTKGGTYGDEDLDFGYRLLNAGCRVKFNIYAISYQNYVVRPRQYLTQVRQTGRADVFFGRKHPGEALAIMVRNIMSRNNNVRSHDLARTLVALSPLTSLFVPPFRALAAALLEHGEKGPATVRFFEQMVRLEYWRGVREAGGPSLTSGVRILVYHAIQDLSRDPMLEPYAMPPELFRHQLKTLRRLGFHFISADQLLDFVRRQCELPRLPVLITFDDCYEEMVGSALPILKELAVPAVAFAVSSQLGGSNRWDQVNGASSLALLDRDGLETLARNGVEIGAHSRTHPRLTKISAAQLEDEVAGSIRELEVAGLRPRMFAYPYGDWNLAVRRAAHRAGLAAAFTADRFKVQPGCDPYLIPRIEIYRQDTGLRFLRKVICPP